ncbi:transcription factor IIA, alpha/beta subunit-domain-containing protein [Hyaloraphidium curvatum]|nr:transcription factor IIA, alpha/beta subunit-domain-containing protein [Hyaloraphidium curvatum]
MAGYGSSAKHNEVVTVYNHIIDTVVAKVEPHFRAMGLESDVIAEFRATWEHKLASVIQAGAAEPDAPPALSPQYVQQIALAAYRPAYAPQQPAAGTQRMAHAVQAAARAQVPAQLQQPGPGRPQQLQQAFRDYDGPAGEEDGAGTGAPGGRRGRPRPKPEISLEIESEIPPETVRAVLEQQFAPRPSASSAAPRPRVGANDGPKPSSDDEEEDEDGADEPDQRDDDNQINSDLDSDDDSDEDPDIEHVILCQYEKVHRVRNKWKCNFKDGIAHVNGRDFLFHKGTGEFEW